jgi:hypothetical protein
MVIQWQYNEIGFLLYQSGEGKQGQGSNKKSKYKVDWIGTKIMKSISTLKKKTKVVLVYW